MTSKRTVAAGLIAMFAAGCTLLVPERERRRFDCNGVSVTVSTRQRVPDWFGGEEYVYATTAGQGGSRIRTELDNNGRWIDQLGASVAEDGSWVRFHVADSRGPAAGRYRYFSVAFVDIRDGTVIRSAYAHSTEEERAAGWFTSNAVLPTQQMIRGHQVVWRPCDDAAPPQVSRRREAASNRCVHLRLAGPCFRVLAIQKVSTRLMHDEVFRTSARHSKIVAQSFAAKITPKG